jgi:putative membrane protein
MVTYNPKDWLKLIFHFHRSDTLRILAPTLLLLGVLTGVFVFLVDRYLHFEFPSLVFFHQISGFIISLVLVFRINTAYDRWWEGRKLWGSLLNSSRNLAVKLNAMISEQDHASRKSAVALISSYAYMMKEHLRSNYKEEELINDTTIDVKTLREFIHKPAYVHAQLTKFALETCGKRKDGSGDFLSLERNINELLDVCGACERIRNTPIPYSYSIFIKKIVFIYIITMPVTFGLSVGYLAIPMVMVIFYAFASLELLSEEIEDPFGTDPNDLPTDEIALKVKDNVTEILIANGKV